MLVRIRVLACAGLLIAGGLGSTAEAQTASTDHDRGGGALRLIAGAAAGLAIHESGHVISAASFGAHPGVRGIRTGVVPFFAVTHDHVSPRREYVISSSGLWLQNGSAEWILGARPDLRRDRAAFMKGMLAFHLTTSTLYGIAGFARAGPPERDTRGMAASLGANGAPEGAIGALVLAPAVLDAYRYFRPQSRWAKWTSRGAKIAMVALALAADRH